MFHFASKGGYYLSAAPIQARPLIEHIRYSFAFSNLVLNRFFSLHQSMRSHAVMN